MQCPNKRCKSKKPLQVARTYANGDQIKRDRRCPKCGEYVQTIERLKSDIENDNRNGHKILNIEIDRADYAESEVSTLKRAAYVLFEAAKSLEIK